MTTIFEVKGLLKDAIADLCMAKDVMLDKDCSELFWFVDQFDELIKQIERDDSSTVELGLHAVCYYLAGIAKSIAMTTLPVSEFVDQKRRRTSKKFGVAKGYQPILRKLIACQLLMADFGADVRRECHNPFIHIISQLSVLLEHPYVAENDLIRKQLTYNIELIEAMSERIYDIAERFENHSLLTIDASLIPGGLIH